MNYDEYKELDGLALAELITSGEASALEVLDAAIARAEEVNPTINAIVHTQYEKARAAAIEGLPPGPFHGVPYLLKDLFFLETGEPASLGSSLYETYVADHDSHYTTLCKAAGLNIMGRSNSPEFGLTPTTEPRLYGPTRNPWNLNYSPGGSSGGAAAAVIAGILPVTHATDGGGSIRIPAANCGLFGLKPSRGRVSMGPDLGEGWGGMSIGHVVSRSVRDSAALLDCTSLPAVGDPYAAPAPVERYLSQVHQDPGRLRIALMRTDHDGKPLHANCLAAVDHAAQLCMDLGHEVTEARPDINLTDVRKHSTKIIASNIANQLRQRWQDLGREPLRQDVELATWAMYRNGLKVTGADYAAAIQVIHKTGRNLAAFHQEYDILLSVTLPVPPPELGYLNSNGEDLREFGEHVAPFLGVTPMQNIAGTPAMNVPLYWNDLGLPIGIQFAGAYGREDILFKLAGQLEQAQPWFDKMPDISIF